MHADSVVCVAAHTTSAAPVVLAANRVLGQVMVLTIKVLSGKGPAYLQDHLSLHELHRALLES